MRTVDEFARTRRAPGWAIWLIVATQVAGDAFINLVVFRHHWFATFNSATEGILNATFWANLIMLVVVIGGIIFGLRACGRRKWA
jgi:hypothetical protein